MIVKTDLETDGSSAALHLGHADAPPPPLLAAGFIGIPRKIMALKILKAIIIDLNYIKGILFFLDLTGE